MVLATVAGTLHEIHPLQEVHAQQGQKTFDVKIEIVTPHTDGLYLQNRLINIKITTTNVGNHTDNANVTILLFQAVPKTSIDSPNEILIDQIHDRHTLVAGNFDYNFVNHSYLAGSYHLIASVTSDKGIGDSEDLYLDISTTQELYSKQQAEYALQQAEYTKEQAISSQSIEAATWNGLQISIYSTATIAAIGIFTMVANMIQARHTKESTDLARLEITERLKPQFELIEGKATIRSSTSSIQFTGRIRNTGAVAAHNITIRSAVVQSDQLEGILKDRVRIMKEEPTIVGTLLPDGKYFYDIDKSGTNRDYVVLWIQYTFLKKQQEESFVLLNLIPGAPDVDHKWWTDEDINPERYSKFTGNKKGLRKFF